MFVEWTNKYMFKFLNIEDKFMVGGEMRLKNKQGPGVEVIIFQAKVQFWFHQWEGDWQILLSKFTFPQDGLSLFPIHITSILWLISSWIYSPTVQFRVPSFLWTFRLLAFHQFYHICASPFLLFGICPCQFLCFNSFKRLSTLTLTVMDDPILVTLGKSRSQQKWPIDIKNLNNKWCG